MHNLDLNRVPPFYHSYINRVQTTDVVQALEESGDKLIAFLTELEDDQWMQRYAADKWSVKEMIQHLIDAERVFAYRSIAIARGEKQSLPSFDENEYASASEADRREPADLVSEMLTLRASTVDLFRSLSEVQLERTGIARGKEIFPRAIGFIIAGHCLHHLWVLNEKYNLVG